MTFMRFRSPRRQLCGRACVSAVAAVVTSATAAFAQTTVTWDGSTDTTWTQPDSTSWSGATYQSGDTAVFGGLGQGTVTIDAGGVTPGQVNVTSGSYTFSGGGIGGSGGIAKSGSGTLTLSGSAANTFSGTTSVTGGELNLAKTSGNAVGGDLSISNALVTFAGTNQISDGAAVTMSGSGAVFNGTGWNAGTNFAFQDTFASLTVTGGIVNAGNTTNGTGITVTGAGSFTGGVGNSEYLLGSGGRGSFGSLALVGMTGTTAPANAAPNTFRLAGNDAGRQTQLTIGSGGLSLNGSNILVALGARSDALGGQIVLNGDVTTLGSTPSSIMAPTSGDGTNGSRAVALSGTAGSVTRSFTIGGGGANLTVSIPITNGSATTAGITKAGAGTLTLSGSAANTFSGTTSVTGGELNLAKTSGNAVGGDLSISNAPVTFAGSNQISDGAAVTMSGSGAVFNGTGWGTGVNFAFQDTFASLTVTGGIVNAGNTTNGTGITVTGAGSFTGGVGNSEYLLGSGGRGSFGSLALVGMTGTTAPANAAPNTFRLAGNNVDRQTQLTIGSGGLSLDGSNILVALGTGSGALGSQIVLNGDVTTLGSTPSNIMPPTSGDGTNGSRAVALSGTAGSVTRSFTIGGGGANLNVLVPITNGSATTAGIRKLGDGILTLGTASTYTGATTIAAGTLALGAGGSFANSSVITIGDTGSSGAVLDISAKTGTFTFAGSQTVGGIGTLKVGDTAAFAGTFAPGNSAGVFTLDGGTTLLSGTTEIEILGSGRGTGYDAVDLVNSAALDYSSGSLLLDFGSALAAEQSYQIFGDGAQAILGSLSSLTLSGSNYTGLTFTKDAGAGVWTSTGTSLSNQTLTFTEGTGTLVIVPEPAVGALAGLGAAAAAWAARRSTRRRSTIRDGSRCRDPHEGSVLQ